MTVLKAPTEPVYVLLDTPGGSVDAGLQFIAAMHAYQNNGGKVICVAKSAVSMGFAIFTECDERYALKDGQLLWHPVRTFIRGPITPDSAKDLYNNLKETDDRLWAPTKKALQISESVWKKHYDAETLHSGRELKKIAPGYLKLIDKIEGAQFFVFDPLQDLMDKFTSPNQPDESPDPQE